LREPGTAVRGVCPRAALTIKPGAGGKTDGAHRSRVGYGDRLWSVRCGHGGEAATAPVCHTDPLCRYHGNAPHLEGAEDLAARRTGKKIRPAS
jgi:hypothetical protein